jgi:fermentation-respiration switch protein FrsA (DUF1100 family)
MNEAMTLALRISIYLLILWVVLVFVGRRMIYFPEKSPRVELPVDAKAVSLNTPDGERISGWWFESDQGPYATIYLHGNGGYLSIYIDHLEAIRKAGSSLLIIDYRGYGESTGSPSESGLYADAQAAYDWLRKRGYPANRIVVQGLSLGTAVAVDLASRNSVGGVVLEAPLSSARAVAADLIGFPGWTLPLGFDSIGKIGKLRAPLLVIHGDRDRVINLRLGRELFDAAPEPKEFFLVPGAGHEDLPMIAGPRYQDALVRLYQRCGR